MNQVYSIVTIGTDGYDGYPSFKNNRLVGLFTERESTVDILARNVFDLYEMGSYPFAVTELLDIDRLYPANSPDSIQWFAWDATKKGYFPISIPAGYERIMGWGL